MQVQGSFFKRKKEWINQKYLVSLVRDKLVVISGHLLNARVHIQNFGKIRMSERLTQT